MTDGKRLNWIQACELLGCKKSHFYMLVNTGRLRAYRYGVTRGVWVYERDCLDLLKKDREDANFLSTSSMSSTSSVTR